MKRNCNIQNITIILQILYFIGRNFFEQLFGGGGHLFCLSCLDKYVKSRLNFADDEDREYITEECIQCPVCRRDINLCSDCNHAKFECGCE
jgi:hypothetical protein